MWYVFIQMQSNIYWPLASYDLHRTVIIWTIIKWKTFRNVQVNIRIDVFPLDFLQSPSSSSSSFWFWCWLFYLLRIICAQFCSLRIDSLIQYIRREEGEFCSKRKALSHEVFTMNAYGISPNTINVIRTVSVFRLYFFVYIFQILYTTKKYI